MKVFLEHPDQLWFDFMASERASELYCDEVLTGDGLPVSLDDTRSVSGLIRFDYGSRLVPLKVQPRLQGAPHDVPPRGDV